MGLIKLKFGAFFYTWGLRRLYQLHLVLSHCVDEPWFKQHFLFSQVWVKGEIMGLKLIGCVCNLLIEREKLKNILDKLLVGVIKFFYFYWPICLGNWRDDHNKFFIFSYLACYDHNNKTIRILKVKKVHNISY